MQQKEITENLTSFRLFRLMFPQTPEKIIRHTNVSFAGFSFENIKCDH